MNLRHWSFLIGSLVILFLAFQVGRQVERVDQVRADQVLVEIVIPKPAAWNRVYHAKTPRAPREDLRLPKRIRPATGAGGLGTAGE